jgi:hypothetical protein
VGRLVAHAGGRAALAVALRVVFGISCVGGTFVAASLFFGMERI